MLLKLLYLCYHELNSTLLKRTSIKILFILIPRIFYIFLYISFYFPPKDIHLWNFQLSTTIVTKNFSMCKHNSFVYLLEIFLYCGEKLFVFCLFILGYCVSVMAVRKHGADDTLTLLLLWKSLKFWNTHIFPRPKNQAWS